MNPKVFISYSWSSQAHQGMVKQWADRLLSDGIDVILDIYDLKEGHDKYSFMESMVTDKSISHVLIVCDGAYAEKADSRKAGVGTESQIISKEVYDKVDQSKFIPIVCEFSPDGSACLPVYLKSRIWIDFSTPEATNENWEQLVRLLYGKALHQKPLLGKAPAYLQDNAASISSPITAKFTSFRQALLQDKTGIALYRRDFIDSFLSHLASLEQRDRPESETLGEKVLVDAGQLKALRDHLIDWVLLEAKARPSTEFSDALFSLLETLRVKRTSTSSINSWENAWNHAYSLFLYETFIYVVAALLEAEAFQALRQLFTSNYLLPRHEWSGDKRFKDFGGFYSSSEVLQTILAPPGRRLKSPAAELIKRHADREDIDFKKVMQGELLVLLMTILTPSCRWFPQTLYYSSYGGEFPFFVLATRHRGFQKLAQVTGIDSADTLRNKITEGSKRLRIGEWHEFDFNDEFHASLNFDSLDTLS